MRALALLLLISGCATSARDFSFFVGNWSGESKFATGEKTSLVWSVKPDGAALNGSSTAKELEVSATDRWSVEGEVVKRDYSDTQGTKGLLSSSGWKNGVWLWEGTITLPDQRRVAIRETITKVDEHTMHARYERNDGAGWEFMSEETLKK